MVQKVGGYASIACGLLLVIWILIAALGLGGSGNSSDPAKGIDLITRSPIAFLAYYLVFILVGIVALLLVLGTSERMQADAPNMMRVALIAASAASVLWLAVGLVGIAGLVPVAHSGDHSAYRAVAALISGLGLGGDYGLGWALLLIGWAALKNKGLPKSLSYLLVIKGVLMILEFGQVPLIAAGMLLGLAAYPWLGIVLLRSKATDEEHPADKTVSGSYRMD